MFHIILGENVCFFVSRVSLSVFVALTYLLDILCRFYLSQFAEFIASLSEKGSINLSDSVRQKAEVGLFTSLLRALPRTTELWRHNQKDGFTFGGGSTSACVTWKRSRWAEGMQGEMEGAWRTVEEKSGTRRLHWRKLGGSGKADGLRKGSPPPGWGARGQGATTGVSWHLESTTCNMQHPCFVKPTRDKFFAFGWLCLRGAPDPQGRENWQKRMLRLISVSWVSTGKL